MLTVSAFLQQTNVTDTDFKAAFGQREVNWSGTVTVISTPAGEVKRLAARKDPRSESKNTPIPTGFQIKMTPSAYDLPDGDAQHRLLYALSVNPNAEDWAALQSLQPGDDIDLRTKLVRTETITRGFTSGIRIFGEGLVATKTRNNQGIAAEGQEPATPSDEAWRHDMAAFAKEALAVAAKSKVPDSFQLTQSMRNRVTFNNASGEQIGVVLKDGFPDELHGELAKRFTGTVEWRGEVVEAKLDEKEGLHIIKIKIPAPGNIPKFLTFPEVRLEISFSRLPKDKSPAKGAQFAFTGSLKKAKEDDLFQPVDVWYGLGSESGKHEVIVSLMGVAPLDSSSTPPVAPTPETRREQKPATAYQFPPGWQHGYNILEKKLYWGSHAMLNVLNGWHAIVEEGNAKQCIVMFPLGAVDVNPPSRSRIMDALGKPEREAKLQYPSEVKIPDGVILLGKPKFQLHCLWYGSIGFGFTSPDKADQNSFAIIFDPSKASP